MVRILISMITKAKKRNHKKVNKEHRRRNKVNVESDCYIEDLVELIDGNLSHYPYAYCKHYGGYVTKNLVLVHSCEEKGCGYLTYDR